jgi:hypothetical protein
MPSAAASILAAMFVVSAPTDAPGTYRLRGSPAVAVAPRAKVYVGKEGVAVTVVRTRDRQPQALVRVTGVDDDVDGRVLRHDVVETAGGATLWTTLHGKRVATLTGTPDDDGALVYELELPSMKRPLRLRYDADLSARASAQALADEYAAKQRR